MAGPSGPAFLYNFYPRSPCGERRNSPALLGNSQNISIHALLAESDRIEFQLYFINQEFLSTLSLRRATFSLLCRILFRRYFYPRSPCGERRLTFYDTAQHTYFYPRSPCGERPCQWRRSVKLFRHFYPRSPCGERHYQDKASLPSVSKFLSTLSLRRATEILYILYWEVINFYPRSPCGERRVAEGADTGDKVFLSTLSLRRATCFVKITSAFSGLFLSTLSLRRATAKVHKTVGHFCAYGTNFMGIASSC